MNAPPPDLWRRIEPILERALELQTGARAAYLEDSCAGNERLQREVENLLAADREAADFLSDTVGDVAASLFRELSPGPEEAPAKLSAGQELGPYRIVRRLGVGGMGEVHEAEDPRLGRRVALKVLPPDLAADAGRLQRFEREARAVAALNHPNIVTIYSVEHADGVPLLALELVEGRRLDEVTPQGGMKLETFLDLALPLADALAAAHEKGITHRDLKPANVMVTGEGRPKVLDFGLAKLQADTAADDASAAETLAATRAGILLGTIPYMSPEQAEGKPVGPRTDVFSLGILLYEMITGERPFQGETPASLITSILRDAPRPVIDVRSDLPASLAKVVHGCLEKDPDRRSAAREVRDELDRLRRRVQAERFLADSGAATPSDGDRRRRLRLAAAAALLAVVLGAAVFKVDREPEAPTPEAPMPEAPTLETLVPVGERGSDRARIVVLPFEHLGGAEDEVFAAGMTEEITSRLAAVGDLGVISRTSARFYATAERTVAQIGEELRVDYVLEGTVRWEPAAEGSSRMRITPQLIRVADDTHVWSEIYERDLAGVFAVQSEIAQRVVDELGVTLLAPEREAIRARPTENLDAYQAYLRGRTFLGRLEDSVRDRRLAVASFERAVELDPDFALAWAELSRARSRIYRRTMDSQGEAARRALERALQLAPAAPEVQLAQAYYQFWVEEDYERALEILNRITRIRPNDAEALEARGYILRVQGRWHEAVVPLERAAELNPRDLWLQGRLATFTLVPMHRYAEAMAVCDRAIALAPDRRLLYDTKAAIYLAWKGDVEKARTALATLPAEIPFSRLMEFYQAIYERDYRAALARLSPLAGEWVEGLALGRWPKPLLEAMTYELLQEPAPTASAYEAALRLAEDELRRRPDDPMIHNALGYVYAGLGRKEAAIRAGKKAVAAGPPLWDAWFRKHLAVIYTRVGEHEAALDELDRVLSLPFEQLSVPILELEPWWDPLRDHPRYRELVRRHRQETEAG